MIYHQRHMLRNLALQWLGPSRLLAILPTTITRLLPGHINYMSHAESYYDRPCSGITGLDEPWDFLNEL